MKQYVQFLAKGVVGVDAKTGKFFWRYDQHGQGQPRQHADAGGRRRTTSTAATGRGGGRAGQAQGGRTASSRPRRSISTASCPPPSAAPSCSATTSTARPARCWSAPISRPARSKWTDRVRRRRIAAATPTAGSTPRRERRGRRWSKRRPRLPREGPLHAARPARPRPVQGVGVPRRRQRPAVHPRHGAAVVLRRQAILIFKSHLTYPSPYHIHPATILISSHPPSNLHLNGPESYDKPAEWVNCSPIADSIAIG